MHDHEYTPHLPKPLFREKEKLEAQNKRLRAEAERAEELSDQLDKSTLKIKQKEAEVRALAVDGKEMRHLRQSVCEKVRDLRLLLDCRILCHPPEIQPWS